MKNRKNAPDDNQWKLVSRFDIATYQCGLKAGMTLRLKAPLVIRTSDGSPTGEVFAAGSEWVVLEGSSEDRTAVFLRDPSGDPHTWDDDPSLFDTFEIVTPERTPK